MVGSPVNDALDLDVSVVQGASGDLVRVTLRGDLDLAVESDLVERVEQLLRPPRPRRVVLDLSGLLFMDSSGLRGVLRCARAAREAEVPLALGVVPGPVTLLLDTAGVTGWFDYE